MICSICNKDSNNFSLQDFNQKIICNSCSSIRYINRLVKFRRGILLIRETESKKKYLTDPSLQSIIPINKTVKDKNNTIFYFKIASKKWKAVLSNSFFYDRVICFRHIKPKD